MGRKIADSRNRSICNFICGGQVDRIRFLKIVFHVRNVDCRRWEYDLQSSLCLMCSNVFRFRRQSQRFFSWIFFPAYVFRGNPLFERTSRSCKTRLMIENRDLSDTLGFGYYFQPIWWNDYCLSMNTKRKFHQAGGKRSNSICLVALRYWRTFQAGRLNYGRTTLERMVFF